MPPHVAQELDKVTDYIKHWTLHELDRMQRQSAAPICIPIKNGYRIGLYTLRLNNRRCEVNNSNNELVHTFEDKRSAVLYTIYTIRQQYKRADSILKLDTEINKNYTDILAWRNHMISAAKRKDFDTVDIRRSRLEIAEKALEQARFEISKIYLTAKYNKIWDL